MQDALSLLPHAQGWSHGDLENVGKGGTVVRRTESSREPRGSIPRGKESFACAIGSRQSVLVLQAPDRGRWAEVLLHGMRRKPT
jgi:hypothetical protein